MAMVDVNKVFFSEIFDKKPPRWETITHVPDTPDYRSWFPRIKPPTDALVWRPVLIFLSVFIISFRSSNTLVLLIRWQRPSMMDTLATLMDRPSLR